jgi:hypothetical protein
MCFLSQHGFNICTAIDICMADVHFENGKWWSKWVQNLKCPCMKMETGGQMGAKSEVAMGENG